MKKTLVNLLMVLVLTSSFVIISPIVASAHLAVYKHTHSDTFDTLRLDPRNKGISFIVRYVGTSKLILDLREVSGSKSRGDVFRVLLQIASEFESTRFASVTLAYKSREKFLLEGSYFQKLGKEYGYQNPVYTARTLPENVYHLNGTQAFGTWTGGIFGVVAKQMEEHNEFHDEWWLNDAIAEYRN